MPKVQRASASFKAPSMHDDQREKQLSSLAHGQRVDNPEFSKTSQANGGDGISTYKSSNPPSPNKIDPFSHHMPPFTIYDKIKLALGTALLVPVRAIMMIFVLVGAWLVAKIGMLGLEKEEIESFTISRKGWRRQLMHWYRYFGYGLLYSVGFKVTIIGKQATRKEAPVLVGAPHSSFVEAVIMIMCGASPVSRLESRDAFLISACQLFSQSIFVDRREPATRKQAKADIKARALSPDQELPQLFLCPEGTNTNRKVLIQFKVGAFTPGVPVQPIVIRYPGHDGIDAITWTFKQSHTYLFSLWCLLATPVNHVEVEFLPVYHPNEEEQNQPELYAKNVQLLMAKALEIPATDITYKKYYAEYCVMYGTQLSANDTDKIQQEDDQVESGTKGIVCESAGNLCDGNGKKDEKKKDK